MAKKAISSEVHAYLFIKENLKEQGWDVHNPLRCDSGQVYTQNECLGHPEIKTYLVLDRPENVIKVTESKLWIIEAKREHRMLEQATNEAIAYASKLNSSKNLQAVFVSGVAGNEHDGYLVRTLYLDSNNFVPIRINGKEASALLSPELAQVIIEDGPEINDVPINEAYFLTKAEAINTILHRGAINKNQRARFMAALLLSLAENPPDVDTSPKVLVEDINTRARSILSRHKRPEFADYIKIGLPSTEDNHQRLKAAIVSTFQELNNLNIRSAMNSDTDVLGKFYEVFLKYGNGAKEIGIVLTPRHITKFVADVLSISPSDTIYDPCCGTGGFLVAAFDAIRRKCTEAQTNVFKQHNLFGVEQELEVLALAIVNMIFRGDGQSNVIDGNCFHKNLVRVVKRKMPTAGFVDDKPDPDDLAVSKVMMNPPFSLKNSDEKEHKFVDCALRQMQPGGVLFSVLPYSIMVKQDDYKLWRQQLLVNNSLLCVVTFPIDLFYPSVNVHTVGIFVKKGIPQDTLSDVLWIRAINDGMTKIKAKRLPNDSVADDFRSVRSLVCSFLMGAHSEVPNIPQFQKACPINFDDPFLELVPENYLDDETLTTSEIQVSVESIIKQSLAHVILHGR